MPEPESIPDTAPDFKQVRSYLRTIQQREALGGFMRAGWSPVELAEFARRTCLVPGKTRAAAASYRYAIERGATDPFAVETLAILRALPNRPEVRSAVSQQRPEETDARFGEACAEHQQHLNHDSHPEGSGESTDAFLVAGCWLEHQGSQVESLGLSLAPKGAPFEPAEALT